MISDLNGSLGCQNFLYVRNERTSFASWTSALESSRLVTGLKWTSDQKVAHVFVTFEWISGGWEKIVPISEPFWSNLIFLRMIDLTAWLWGGNVRVNGMRSPCPTNWSQSALQTAEKENTDHILFNHAVKSIRWPIYVFNSVVNVKYLLEAIRSQVNEKIDEKTHY